MMTRRQYVETVLDEIEKYPWDQASYILAIDRRMTYEVASECIDIAISLKSAGRRVVGVDLCGDPLVSATYAFLLSLPTLLQAGNMNAFATLFQQAKLAGLGITLHIAEVGVFYVP